MSGAAYRKMGGQGLEHIQNFSILYFLLCFTAILTVRVYHRNEVTFSW